MTSPKIGDRVVTKLRWGTLPVWLRGLEGNIVAIEPSWSGQLFYVDNGAYKYIDDPFPFYEEEIMPKGCTFPDCGQCGKPQDCPEK